MRAFFQRDWPDFSELTGSRWPICVKYTWLIDQSTSLVTWLSLIGDVTVSVTDMCESTIIIGTGRLYSIIMPRRVNDNLFRLIYCSVCRLTFILCARCFFFLKCLHNRSPRWIWKYVSRSLEIIVSDFIGSCCRATAACQCRLTLSFAVVTLFKRRLSRRAIGWRRSLASSNARDLSIWRVRTSRTLTAADRH